MLNMAKKKPAKKTPKQKAKPDFSQTSLSAVEKLIGGKLSDGIAAPRKQPR
jgi:hypothetical protein